MLTPTSQWNDKKFTYTFQQNYSKIFVDTAARLSYGRRDTPADTIAEECRRFDAKKPINKNYYIIYTWKGVRE